MGDATMRGPNLRISFSGVEPFLLSLLGLSQRRNIWGLRELFLNHIASLLFPAENLLC